jgi:hypothetical protein
MDNEKLFNGQMPMGLGMALVQNLDAMKRFNQLSQQGKQAIIEGSHSIQSKEDMKAYVSSIGKDSYIS